MIVNRQIKEKENILLQMYLNLEAILLAGQMEIQ
jgi:hypothetical protein